MGKEREIETQRSNWGTGLKAEFNKIIWPLKEQLAKEGYEEFVECYRKK